jgi:hypothetical protein
MNLERVSEIGRPSSGVPTARKSRGRAISPGPAAGRRGEPKAGQISYPLAACSFTTSICLSGSWPMKQSITNAAWPKHRAKVGCTQ